MSDIRYPITGGAWVLAHMTDHDRINCVSDRGDLRPCRILDAPCNRSRNNHSRMLPVKKNDENIIDFCLRGSIVCIWLG